MVTKIKNWNTRHLSFAGRMQLVNSVLISICVYWGKIVLLHEVTTQKITVVAGLTIFWVYDDCRPGSVGWDNLCNSKDQGSLGFRNLSL